MLLFRRGFWLLILVAEYSVQLHKAIAAKLRIVVMAFCGGIVVIFRRWKQINTPFYQTTEGLHGKMIVPDWCDFGELVWKGKNGTESVETRQHGQ